MSKQYKCHSCGKLLEWGDVQCNNCGYTLHDEIAGLMDKIGIGVSYDCPDCKIPLIFGADDKGKPYARCSKCRASFIVVYQSGRMRLFGAKISQE